MLIPKKMRIGEYIYTISQQQRSPRRGTMALVNLNQKTITLGTHHSRTGVAYKTEDVDDSFWHETVHAILHEMGEKRLCSNEAFVTKFANILTGAINSAEF